MIEPPTWAELGGKGKLIRIRQCAFDDDITDIVERGSGGSSRSTIEALVDCLRDIRDILEEEL